jgi:hypothetical protein
MFVYATAPGANVATNATPNTLTDHLRTLTGSARQAIITALLLQGKGAGLTALTGIAVQLNRYGTASTSGSAITPQLRQPSAPAAVLTAFTGPTRGTTPTLQLAVGMGAAGPGGWVARDQDSGIALEAGGGAKGNLDLESITGGTSLNFEYTLEHAEP